MGVAWVIRDSPWNVSCALNLVEWLANRTLQAASIDMSFAPPLIGTRVYHLDNFYWVLCLLLIAPTREYPCVTSHTLLGQTRRSWLLLI